MAEPPTDNFRHLRVFLSYASEDRAAVLDLYTRLKSWRGIARWLDVAELLAGQDWQLEIARALGESDVVILCLSQRSVVKEGYVQREMRHAIDLANEKPEGTIFVVPVRLDQCEEI